MSTSEPPSDPIAEIETLSAQLASLQIQLNTKKISNDQFEQMSKQLRDKLSDAESQAFRLAKTNDSVAKKLRARTYREPKVQQVCSHFVYGSKRPLEPEFGKDRVPAYFLDLAGEGRVPVERSLLEQITDLGILKREIFERLLFCPKCNSPSAVYVRFRCTQCGSIDISINRMIEHLNCGTIHQETAFRSGGGSRLICPSCKKPLEKPEQWRLIGLMCSCNKCGAHFEDPVQGFHCRNCKSDFNLATAQVTDVHIYTINNKILGEIRSQLGIPVIVDVLKAAGYEVTSPGLLMQGEKSAQFSILARQSDRTVAIDLYLSDSEVEVEPVLEMYVKLLEVSPSVAIFAGIPRLSKKARDVAGVHKILVAEGATPELVAQRTLELSAGSAVRTARVVGE